LLDGTTLSGGVKGGRSYGEGGNAGSGTYRVRLGSRRSGSSPDSSMGGRNGCASSRPSRSDPVPFITT